MSRVLRPAAFRRTVERSDGWIEPSKFSARELVTESIAGILQRPGRSLLTAMGTVLGVGTLVAILGLTTTASSQISSTFNVLLNTQVTVADVSGVPSKSTGTAFAPDAEGTVESLHGVERAGVYWGVSLPDHESVSSSPLNAGTFSVRPTVLAASPGLLPAAGAKLAQGRLLNEWDQRTHQRVAVLGSGAAKAIGICTLSTQPELHIGDQSYAVVGILQNVDRKSDLLSDVIIPSSTAFSDWGVPADPGAAMLIVTRPGAAAQIAREAPTALRPEAPNSFQATAPPDPQTLRSSVAADLNQLFLLLGAISLVIGAVGIANTSLVAVMERTGEIGLRRALGAQRRHISAQFLTEAMALGALGGLVGTSLGVITVLSVAIERQWTPVMSAAVLLTSPLVGLATGAVAGLYPARRAANVEPVAALRR